MIKLDALNSAVWRIAALSVVGAVGVLIYVSIGSTAQGGDEAVANRISVFNEARAQSGSPDPKRGLEVEDIWKPAATPPGGTSWALLERAQEVTRKDENDFIISYPLFTREQRQLEGKRIKVSGWMDPLQVGSKQKRFILLGYPPGCPFHFHAAPMQFIEVMASTPFETDRTNVTTVSGVLELTGYDESGVFYRLWDARPA